MTATDVRPPIPVRLADNPVQGGVVVPWIQVRLADGGADFRATHQAKWRRCWMELLCQLCGQRLTRPMVLFGGPRQIAPDGYHDEAPMHPECARYAAAACPMVSGRMDSYSARPVLSEGRRGATCPTPGCDCGGWVPHRDDYPDRQADPAHAWFAVWCDDFALVLTPEGRLLGGRPINPRRTRTLCDPTTGRTD